MITGNGNRGQERKHRFYWMFFINMQQVVQELKAFACCIVTVNDRRHMRRLCLKLWFKSDWYFCNIIVSRWFWKRLSGNKVPNNHFLKSVQKQSYADVLQNRCSWKLCNSKTLVLESLFNRVEEETPTQGFSRKHCEIFRNNFVYKTLRWLLLSVW